MSLRQTVLPLFLLALCLLALVPFGSGQTETATLSGLITDPQGKVVPGVAVEITNVDTNVIVHQTTNGAGLYVAVGLKPGRYRVSVTKDGFRRIDLTDLVLNVQDVLSRNFQLQLGPVLASITVVADSANVNTTDAAVSTVVDRNFAENLPLNGRSFNTLLQLTPGTVMGTYGTDAGQFSVNGQRISSNYFSVDGVSANFGVGSGLPIGQGSGSTQAFNSYGGTSSLVSVDALQEFRVETSSFAPEFGTAPGAQVIISTRSGTNNFHGGVFDYFRNDVLDASDWFNGATAPPLPKSKERQNDFGGTLGGPIVKDRTFFFFSYEGLRLRLPVTQTIQVPTVQLRNSAVPGAALFLNAFPLPNGPLNPDGVSAQFAGGFSNSVTLNATSLRMDHTVNSHWGILGRFNHAPSSTTQRSGGLSELDSSIIDTDTFTVGSELQISPSVTNSTRFNYSVQHGALSATTDNFGGAVPVPTSTLLPQPFSASAGFAQFFPVQIQAGYSAGHQSNNHTHQININDNVTKTVGGHQIKLGADYRQLRLEQGGFNPGLVYVIVDLAGFAATGNADEVVNQTNARTNVRFRTLGVYAQDTWRVHPRLTLTYGLRWEINPAPTGLDGTILAAWRNVDDPANTILAPIGTPVWNTRYAEFAPRIGIAYQLTQGGGFVLRAGFGIFSDQATSTIPILATSFPNSGTAFALGVPLPLANGSAVTVPPVSLTPPYPFVTEGFAPNLTLPRSYQWNVALEKLFSKDQTLAVTYVGQAGRELLRDEIEAAPNPNFPGYFELARNGDTSDYRALQVQFKRRLSRGLQALVNYTLAHSIDTSSFNTSTLLPLSFSPQSIRGNSDFDVRHSFSGALTYLFPSKGGQGIGALLSRNWGVDLVAQARSALPVNVTTRSPLVQGAFAFIQPDLVAGQPIWIADNTVGGGRRLNSSAFAVPSQPGEGTFRRNSIRGFHMSQLDLSVHREFGLLEHAKLQARADFFNILNHPNFADPRGAQLSGSFVNPDRSTQMLNSGLGGLSPIYQVGGPRSIQLSLKVTF
jgi:hypothetical protein